MIALEMRNLGGGEILHACPQESLDKPLPCIVFYHGFTSSKLVYSYFAVALAEAGFRVIMPDAPEHGARYQGDEAGRMQRFWPILQQNFREFPALREAIIAEGWLEGERLAVAGASMGNDGVGHHDASPRAEQRRLSDGVGLFSFPVANPVPSPDFDVDSLNEWDVSHQLASLPGDRCCSGMAMPMTWCRRKRPSVLSRRCGKAILPPLTCVWQKGVRHRITPEALATTVAFFSSTFKRGLR